MEHVERHEAFAALDAAYGAVDAVAASLTQDELVAPSGCRGWLVSDLLFHMLLDAQRALVTFHSPTPGPADKDFVDYWRGFTSTDEWATGHARFVRVSSAAHSSPDLVVRRWRETAAAARRAASAAEAPFVTTQGHVLTTADFIATLVVEATIHHVDLVATLRDKPPPPVPAIALTTKTLDGLLASPRPSEWDDLTYLRKATGRETLTEAERRTFGTTIPVFS
ncbi:MAG TPA: maleylpyruvate isomerase family mycothiol-dependent enzyme [Actinomycetota bacterium]|nr:maleylpyruvate isomerase family mycothiol-dependent enzyme [Actinomycetota bacterium]